MKLGAYAYVLSRSMCKLRTGRQCARSFPRNEEGRELTSRARIGGLRIGIVAGPRNAGRFKLIASLQ